MKRLIQILRAAHCRSTHQFFVVDSLPQVSTTAGQNLASQFLKHHRPYLIGAKAPDKDFRDFRNHVLHVQDNYWGGAPKAAQEWYDHLVQEIRDKDWVEAAYCAGVLSHYFTDPLMPLHTAQSKKESVVHRPLEWSVTKSYDRILRRYEEQSSKTVFKLSHGKGWLGDAVRKGAEISNRHYNHLIDRYDLTAGAKKPKQGFDQASIDILAGLFGVALTGWANIVDRAAEEANVDIPAASLSIPALLATITMPTAWVIRRIESASEQKAVRAIFDEYQSTGTLEKNLPPEVADVNRERERDRAKERKQRKAPATTRRPAVAKAKHIAVKQHQTSPTVPLDDQTATKRRQTSSVRNRRKPSLLMTDDLVDAPSIGPKTAKRFAAIGILSVQQFLAGSPGEMAAKLDTRWITDEIIQDWQAQARLVSAVASLCGYKSQLLVGVDCRSVDSLAISDASELHSKIAAFAKTTQGKRALRSSKLPDADSVAQWIADAVEVTSLRKSA